MKFNPCCVSGCPPFSEERKINLKLRDQILSANYVFNQGQFKNVSDQAKDLIDKLLQVEVENRISSDEILQHPWLQVKLGNIYFQNGHLQHYLRDPTSIH